MSLLLTVVSQSDVLGFRSQDRCLPSLTDGVPLLSSHFWLQFFQLDDAEKEPLDQTVRVLHSSLLLK